MVLTTLMIGFVIFRVWKWNPLWAGPLYLLLLALDLGLFAASSTKLLAGGWLPVAIASVLMVIFSTWHRGRRLVSGKIVADAMPRWREQRFSAMVRNAEQPMTFFCLPINRVVELGSQVEI